MGEEERRRVGTRAGVSPRLPLLLSYHTLRMVDSSSSSRPRLRVLHSPLSLLHNPPHEILSGALQPYFESPDRYHRILDALFPSRASTEIMSSNAPALWAQVEFEDVELDWKAGQVGEPWVLAAIGAVHSKDYLAFLEGVYREWIAEGGSKVHRRGLSYRRRLTSPGRLLCFPRRFSTESCF